MSVNTKTQDAVTFCYLEFVQLWVTKSFDAGVLFLSGALCVQLVWFFVFVCVLVWFCNGCGNTLQSFQMDVMGFFWSWIGTQDPFLCSSLKLTSALCKLRSVVKISLWIVIFGECIKNSSFPCFVVFNCMEFLGCFLWCHGKNHAINCVTKCLEPTTIPLSTAYPQHIFPRCDTPRRLLLLMKCSVSICIIDRESVMFLALCVTEREREWECACVVSSTFQSSGNSCGKAVWIFNLFGQFCLL